MKGKYYLIFLFLLFFDCTPINRISLPDPSNDLSRYLIFTADDFGASININEGIELAADKKMISSISVLSNFTESLIDLKRITTKHPNIGTGVHLNITTGKPISKHVPSLVNPSGNFYTFQKLITRIHLISKEDLKKELRAQILALRNNQFKVDHLSDQHGILLLYNPFFEVVVELAREYNVPIRSPLLSSVKFPKVFTNHYLKKRMRRNAFQLFITHPLNALRLLKYTRLKEMEKKITKLDEIGVLHPDLLIVSFYGKPTKDNLLFILENLPWGISEIILHLGTETRQEYYPSGLESEYFKNRELELNTLTSDSITALVNHYKIKLIGYQNIREIKNKSEIMH